MYGQDFYDAIRAGIQSSAAVVAPIVSDLVRPRTVLDVGCGEGWWAQAFEDATGHTVAQGVDGPGVPADAPIREMGFTEVNLAKPGTVSGSFDLVVCLEVAEHLPPRRAATFVAELCQAAPVVMFSAAIPGQGGTGHINEAWPGYWVDLFAGQGFRVDGSLRFDLWGDDRVENWYRQNLLLASVEPLPGLAYGPVLPVVHPVLYDARRR